MSCGGLAISNLYCYCEDDMTGQLFALRKRNFMAGYETHREKAARPGDLLPMVFTFLLLVVFAGDGGAEDVRETTATSPIVFALDQPVPGNEGGLFAHDVNGDGVMDIVVTSDKHIGVYECSGKKLWAGKVNIRLFEALHHPSAIAGDLDGDGQQEVAYFTPSNQIEIRDAATGSLKKTIEVSGKPIAMAIANLRGKGDTQIIIQYSQTHLKAISADDATLLWETREYRGVEHSPLRQADLDGDGFDEIAGVSIIDHDGKKMNRWDLGDVYKAMDSIVIADIVPGYPLEIALAEQRGAASHTDVVNHQRIIFRALNPWDWEDPDKLAVGDFDIDRPGLEIFNRSSGGDGTAPRDSDDPNGHEDEIAPWVLDSKGKLINKYYLNDKKPSWWTGEGLEEISKIDWDGDGQDEIVGKERHKVGAGAIINPITGEFRKIFRAKAARIYAADVLGDYREEVIILDEGGFLKIFWNDQSNTNPPRPRYWK